MTSSKSSDFVRCYWKLFETPCEFQKVGDINVKKLFFFYIYVFFSTVTLKLIIPFDSLSSSIVCASLAS